jgi:hypothetical protein
LALNIVQVGSGLPGSFTVDPSAEFQSGMIAQIKIIGNDIVVGVSDGTAPIGIIDDIRTSAFTRQQIDEVVEISVSATSIDGNGNLVNAEDVTGVLQHPSIVENSFTSTLSVALNPVNGIITVPSGTVLNYDFSEDGTPDGFRIITSYTYSVPNVPGDDTTTGSGRITVHYQRGFYATDQYDPRQAYPINATLFVGLDGKLTTKQATDNHPGIAIVTGPPSSINSTLEFMWL